ncbi:hypothetical protein VroAM7_13530 [Vibrio rotiferianus]|uniref:Uncharacterized protein n=1 Tax=Vibrio rotiferianus TaxID=190895 RepID=A0A510I8K8_9VIBR|nr:hypothetical protein [Vibrio rotiferianus]BBL88700.1 hypothetical protein VroAM7_13530 [Vibrio rotiferianus]
MPKNRLLALFLLTVIAGLSSLLGNQVYHYLNDPFRLYEGSWQGEGAIYVGDKKIDSNAFMLVNNNDIRLSINNKYQDFSYTYDGNLVLQQREHVSAHFDIENRHVRGLEAFIENTKIDVPLGGNLLRLNAWHLDEGRIFVEVEQSNGLDVSYILTRKSDS